MPWLVTRGSPTRGVRKHELAGIAQVELVKSDKAVAGYCAKYVSKGGQVELFNLGP